MTHVTPFSYRDLCHFTLSLFLTTILSPQRLEAVFIGEDTNHAHFNKVLLTKIIFKGIRFWQALYE